MNAIFDLPEYYDLIDRGRMLMAIHSHYRNGLMAQGIDNPDLLLRQAPALPGPSGRGKVLSLPIHGFPGERMIGRRYLRGGALRFINRDRYLDRYRPVRELAVTAAARGSGIPTVEILAAVSIRTAGPLHRCFLFSRELPGCIDLPAYLRGLADSADYPAIKSAALARAAGAVRLMHDRGFVHADLNMKNILIDATMPEKLYIIDWDRSRRLQRVGEDLRRDNAVRFCRSMIKLSSSGLPADYEDAEVFFRAYRDDAIFVQSCSDRLRSAVARRRGLWKLLNG